jgi:CheY-like chemotaxis protein
MDGKSGMDFIAELRQKHNLIPFIFLTGAATKSVAVEALRNGAFDLLEKPIEPEELARVLRSAGQLVHRIQSDEGVAVAGADRANLVLLRSSARAFDDLASEAGETLGPAASDSVAGVAAGAHDAQEPHQGALHLQVRGHIDALLSRSDTAIKQLETGQFALTALSFLCRSFNVARESADQIDDAVLSAACETACHCFSYFRVSPKALSKENLAVLRLYNGYLRDLNRHGPKALKTHSQIIAEVQRMEQALDLGVAS